MSGTPAFDLVIRNARVATAADQFDADIGIVGGRIVALAQNLPAAPREIDAAGRQKERKDPLQLAVSDGCSAVGRRRWREIRVF